MVGAASDVQIYPGAYNGGVPIYMLGTYPLYSSSFKAATTALTPANIKALVPQHGKSYTWFNKLWFTHFSNNNCSTWFSSYYKWSAVALY